MNQLNERYALVTGAGKGIGKTIAARLLADGVAGVALIDYDEKLVNETALELDATGKKAIAIACDVSKPEQVKACVRKVTETFGAIDILVNNAGITRDSLFHKMEPEQWSAVIDINLNGPFYFCREIVPLMREREYGRIINLSSAAAYGTVGQANYSASKSALFGLTKTLAKEGAARNITVNCVAPGAIDTDMFQAVPDAIIQRYLQQIPMKRLGKTDEIASVVSFLASDDASYLTGQCINVNGGYYM